MSSSERGPESFFPSLPRLRAFVEVARLESISRASETLRRTQSAVTQAIQKLEAELTVELFARRKTGCFPTTAGQILQRRADTFFQRLDWAFDGASTGSTVQKSAIRARVTRTHILALISIHEHISFEQAARHSNLALSSLQRAVRSVEALTGARLFEPASGFPAFTRQGTQLANEFRLAVRELWSAQEEIRSQGGRPEGSILVGSLGNHFVARRLVEFIAEHGPGQVMLTNGTYDEHLAKLRSGHIDFLVGLLKDPSPVDDVVEEKLGDDPYVIAANSRHPLAALKDIQVADLLRFEWVFPRRSARRRSVLEGLFAERPLPHFSVETHSIPMVLDLLVDSERLVLLTRSELAQRGRSADQVAVLDFAIQEPPAAIGVTTRRNWDPTPIQRLFLEFLRARRHLD